VSVSGQENVDLPERVEKVLDCLVAVRDEWSLPVIISTHPRTRILLEALSRCDLDELTFHEPFGYLDHNKLQIESECVILGSDNVCEEG
jgi:UDP-N-acetylglucosamine 2-epimerase (non-hydrolysing)